MLMTGCNEPANHKSQVTNSENAHATSGKRIPKQYIVTLKNAANDKILREAFSLCGIKSIKSLSKGRYLLILENDPGPEEVAKLAATIPDVHYIQPNYIYRKVP